MKENRDKRKNKMKKIFASVLTLSLFIVFAGSASACYGGGCFSGQIGAGNTTVIENEAIAISSTGGNQIIDVTKYCSRNGGDNDINTGDAMAMAGTINVANTNLSEGCCGFGSRQSSMFNNAMVANHVQAKAYTGGNGIKDIAKYGARSGGDNDIDTGDATAMAGAITVANVNEEEGCCGGQKNIANYAMVSNQTVALADTGSNEIKDIAKGGSSSYGDNDIDTGDADSYAGAITVVNTNISRGWGIIPR